MSAASVSHDGGGGVQTRRRQPVALGVPGLSGARGDPGPAIAWAGGTLLTAPNPDAYVLALPLELDAQGLAVLVFLGGFSAAAGMVTVTALAMSTMLVNNLVGPLFLAEVQRGGLAKRFLMCVAPWFWGWWARLSVPSGLDQQAALAGIGLVAFAGVAQLAPALLFGLYWRKANRAARAGGHGRRDRALGRSDLDPQLCRRSTAGAGRRGPVRFASILCLAANVIAFIIAVAFSS
ncbi:MAG: hypothetical protein JKP95_02595, partial [Oceanicaulis sp.]|nr:hypothetical protein [Oceanicaulis sp.]